MDQVQETHEILTGVIWEKKKELSLTNFSEVFHSGYC